MATNNIKIFDENKSNMMSTQEYSTNAQRLNGVQQGVASSMLQNKTLYQVSLIAYAIGQMMVNNGLDANDENAVSTFVGNLANTIVQKIVDKASTSEAQAGTDANKFMTPATTLAAINVLKATSEMATAGTDTTHWMTPALVKNSVEKFANIPYTLVQSYKLNMDSDIFLSLNGAAFQMSDSALYNLFAMLYGSKWNDTKSIPTRNGTSSAAYLGYVKNNLLYFYDQNTNGRCFRIINITNISIVRDVYTSAFNFAFIYDDGAHVVVAYTVGSDTYIQFCDYNSGIAVSSLSFTSASPVASNFINNLIIWCVKRGSAFDFYVQSEQQSMSFTKYTLNLINGYIEELFYFQGYYYILFENDDGLYKTSDFSSSEQVNISFGSETILCASPECNGKILLFTNDGIYKTSDMQNFVQIYKGSISKTTFRMLMKGHSLIFYAASFGAVYDFENDTFIVNTSASNSGIVCRTFDICCFVPMSNWVFSSGHGSDNNFRLVNLDTADFYLPNIPNTFLTLPYQSDGG